MIALGRGVVDWVAAQLGGTFTPSAQGIGWLKDGAIIAGAVFDNYNTAQIWMHIAKLRGECFSPTFVATIMDYPFNQLKVKRVTGTIARKNAASRAFARKLGATLEGIHPEALPNDDLCTFGLLRKDAEKWLTKSYARRLGVPNGRNCKRRIRQESVAAARA